VHAETQRPAEAWNPDDRNETPHQRLDRHFSEMLQELLVEVAHRLTLAGLALLALTAVGSLLLVLEVLLGWPAALALSAGVAVVFPLVWVVLPLPQRHGG